jgi:hypothetical protein
MSATRMYRVASVLLVLYAAAHQFGFRQVDPRWNADGTVMAMKMVFDVQGQSRSYWDFFSAFGFFATSFLLFAALLAWQLAAAPAAVRNELKMMRWAFAACFVVLTIITWLYVFPLPAIFSGATALVLVLAARPDSAATS